MIRISLGVVVLLATASAAVGQEPEEGKQSLPSTAIDLERNNPAKAASNVSEALKKERDIPAEGISVTTHADTVVVSGEVSSEAEAARVKAAAEAAAKGSRVSSRLEVNPATETAVQTETARVVRSIEDALRGDARTANLGVTVSVDEKHVIGLHGLLPSRASRTAAESVATRAAGSRQVRSHLVVPGG